MTKHFDLIFLQLRSPFLKPSSDLISVVGRKKAAYSRKDFKSFCTMSSYLQELSLPVFGTVESGEVSAGLS